MTGEIISDSTRVALVFPPFLFNRFRGPYLALPHLAAFLRSRGQTAVTIYDANSRVQELMSCPSFLYLLLSEAEDGLRGASVQELRKQYLQQLLLLRYLCEHSSDLHVDQHLYRAFRLLILDRYYAELDKDISTQLQAINRTIGLAPLYQGIDETIAAIPPATKLLGITVPTADQFYPAVLLALSARRRFGRTMHITLGGCLFSFFEAPELQALLSGAKVDSIVRYEGELALLGLCQHVAGALAMEELPNLVFQNDKGLQFTPIKEPVHLEDCPAPEFPPDLLAHYAASAQLPILIGRGCYWRRCAFCDYSHLRSRTTTDAISAARAVDVVEQLVVRHGNSRFELVSDCVPPNFCAGFSKELLKRRVNIEWMAYVKGDRLYTADLCMTMARSGCRQLNIGVESFNNRLLHSINKGYTQAEILSMLRYIANAGIRAAISIIMDIPGGTLVEMMETLRCLQEYRELYSEVKLYPFSLSRYSAIADRPAAYGVRLCTSSDVTHNRGFHYLSFKRLRGVNEDEWNTVMNAYMAFQAGNEREKRTARSLEALKGSDSLPAVVCPQPRLYFLSSIEASLAVEMLRLDRLDPNEGLLFDLDVNTITRFPSPLEKVYHVLPTLGVDLAQLHRAVAPESTECSGGANQINDIVACGVSLGLLQVLPCNGASACLAE